MSRRDAVTGAARRGLDRLRTLPPRPILIAAFTWFLLYGFPGYMSNDSALQLHEGRSHHFTDGHPPIMAAVWGVLDAIVSGPILMLLLQGLLFLWGLYRLLSRRLAPCAAAWTAAALLVFPPILTPMAVIWKDSQMAAFLLVGTALLLAPGRRDRWLGVASMTIACAYRHNGFAAAVPLVGLLFELGPGMRWWQRYAISGAVAIGVTLGGFAITRILVHEHQKMTPAFGDIVGVLTHTTRVHDDEELRHVLRGTPLRVTTGIQAHARAIYSPRNYYQVSRGDDRLFDDPVTPEHWRSLDRAWKEIVLGDLGAYVRFRWAAYCELLGLTESDLMAPVWTRYLEQPEQMAWLDHAASHSRFQAGLGERMHWLSLETPLFRPYLYVAIALLLLVLAVRDRLTLALVISGLNYELSFFPTAGAPDSRYSHWMITCTCIAAVLLFAQRLRRGLPAGPA